MLALTLKFVRVTILSKYEATQRCSMSRFNLNHIVAILGLILAIGSYIVLKTFGAPDKICVGAGVLSALVTAIFWSCVMLGTEEDDEE